jgi:hypothetical protein
MQSIALQFGIYALGRQHLMSRAEAFTVQGVELSDPELSRSGLRADGSVVLAVPQDLVHEDEHGFRCLLWTPPAGPELMTHCRMAVLQARADGLLVRQDGMVHGHSVLSLRVRRVAESYWATWGSSVRAMSRRSSRGARAERFLATQYAA